MSVAHSRSSRDPLLFSPDELCSMIPHGGDMCLLERIESWDKDSIRCSTDTHRDPNNPLRRDGGLSILHGLEYGAQAMAVHGALLAGPGGAPLPGAYLAAVHGLRLMVSRLDREQQRLQVEAHRLFVARQSLIYHVLVEAGGKPLMTARITVMPRSGEGP